MNLFVKNKLFEFIHVETSQKCNLACPMCPREMLLEKGYLDKSQLSVNNFTKIFDSIIDNTGKFFLSGNYSDPMMNTDIESIVEYCLSGKQSHVQIGSNGSLRKPEVWYNLGKMMRKHYEKHKRWNSVLFAIDGLEDTNPIYRVNSKWWKIMENAKAFIDGGGFAEWKYIVFEHNEHQVEKAEQLSKEMGFITFNKILSMRFVDWFGEVRKDTEVERSTKEDVLKYINHENDEIHCDAIDKNGIFVTDKGMVLPCCWVGNEMGYNWQVDKISKKDYGAKHLKESYPDWEYELNALEHGIDKVMEHPIWEDLINLWGLGQPLMCYRQCGKKLDDIKHQTIHKNALD